ncbi:MAG: hypothetical protein CM15mP116_08460 [Synechococcus sp.]|nr:MAG: hypothetical protein CM15mP116_08460 [Synechococcus sp.]
MLRHGVRWVRLDAVGFIWKTPGTGCIHLPEAHRIVEVLRQLMERSCSRGGGDGDQRAGGGESSIW